MTEVLRYLSKEACGDCWAYRKTYYYTFCMANDKFRETCQSSLFKEKGE